MEVGRRGARDGRINMVHGVALGGSQIVAHVVNRGLTRLRLDCKADAAADGAVPVLARTSVSSCEDSRARPVLFGRDGPRTLAVRLS